MYAQAAKDNPDGGTDPCQVVTGVMHKSNDKDDDDVVDADFEEVK